MGTIRLIRGCARSIPPSPGLQQMQGGSEKHPPPVVLGAPPPFPLSQPSCSSTWVQNHEFSKSLKTTQRGSQGTRGFQRRAALPCISKSCPTADLSPPPAPHTHTHMSQNCFPKKPAQPFSPHPAPPPPGWGRLSIPRVSHLPFPRPLPPS